MSILSGQGHQNNLLERRTRLSPLRPGFDTRRRHMRWSCGHQVRQVGFLRALRFPPTRGPSERKHWCQRA